MTRFLRILGVLAFIGPAVAADNQVIIDPGSTTTMRSRDVGAGVQSMQQIVGDVNGNALSAPTAGADGVSNTALGLLNYARLQMFNGTTWDRLVGDTTNGVWVNIKSSTSIAVTGTFWQATQPISAAALPLPSGAATSAKQPALGTAGTSSADVITVQGRASMTPLLVDGSGATQPVSGTVTANAGTNLNTSTLALETGGNLATVAGAVTSSVMQSNTKQVNGVTTLAGAGAVGTGSQRVAVGQDTTTIAGSAPGTAGSASTNVLSVQGIASMTPFLTNPGTAANWGVLAQNAATSGQLGGLALGAVTTASPSYTTAQTSALSLDTAGSLRVAVISGGGTGGTSSTFGAAFPGTGTALGLSDGTNMVAGLADGSGNLKVNCASGCSGGTFNNNADNVATSSSNGQSASWGYVWDGSAWDRLYGDSTNGAFVNVKTSVLPTGASTAAKQPALGTAGTASSDVITIQGIASMTKLLVTPDSVALPANQSVNTAQVNGVTTLTGTGAVGTGAQRVAVGTDTATIAGSAPGTAGSASSNVVTVQGVASMTKLLVTPDANSAVNLAQVGGTNTVNGGVAGSQSVGGTVATNVAITANPLNLGAQAVSSENTAVTTARQVQLVADLVGKLIVLPYSNPENFVSGVITSAMTGTTSTSLVAAPASGLRNYITACTFSNAHATVGTDIILQDGSGGTTIWNVPAAAVYGGAHITFPTPLRQPTTATALYVANVTTGASTKAACSGYKGA